jgi:hypothetical protein
VYFIILYMFYITKKKKIPKPKKKQKNKRNTRTIVHTRVSSAVGIETWVWWVVGCQNGWLGCQTQGWEVEKVCWGLKHMAGGGVGVKTSRGGGVKTHGWGWKHVVGVENAWLSVKNTWLGSKQVREGEGVKMHGGGWKHVARGGNK